MTISVASCAASASSPGITDNRYTEVVSGELEPGGQVVVEDRQAAAAASPPAGTLPDTAVLMPAAPVIRPLAPWQALRDRGGAIPVLKDVNLDIGPAEFVTIM